jgi:hypothetical protein
VNLIEFCGGNTNPRKRLADWQRRRLQDFYTQRSTNEFAAAIRRAYNSNSSFLSLFSRDLKEARRRG